MTEESRNRSENEDLDEALSDPETALKGVPTLPGGTSATHRRRFLKAMGATAVLGASAGCLGLFSRDPATVGTGDDDVDYSEIDEMKLDWVPKQVIKNLNVQVAFNSEKIFFRFNWEQPNAGGWYHDCLAYVDGEWRHYTNPDPWVADEDHPDHTGFYEDRLSFLLDDGSVKGFENFGGWLTVHMGTRSLPGAATAEEVTGHPYLGDDGLGKSDVRKFLPHVCEGEWWENQWDAIRPEEELDELRAEGVFLDLPMWRSHRSNPMGYGTDHNVHSYRHSDPGQHTYATQDWDPDDGPTYMMDPDVVEDGALELERMYDAEYEQALFYENRDEWLGEEEPYWLHEDWRVEFDPAVAEWEGAVIPRRMLQEATESYGDWRVRGVHDRDAGEWTVDMWRDLDTGTPLVDKQFEPGGVYDWAPAIHHGYNQRWHWVAYPYKLGLGQGTDADIRAVQFDGAEPNWDDVPTHTIPLIYPGQVDWTWLTSKQHRGYRLVRNNEMAIWDIHENPRRMAALLIGKEVGGDPRR